MLTEGRVKRVVLTAALDICLRRMYFSPERCARNLMELGLSAFPNKFSKKEQTEISHMILTACKSGDTVSVKELFLTTFL